MDLIFSALLLLFVAISVVWSVFVRKLVKTRIKSIFVIVCVVLALVGTVGIKNFVLDPAFAEGTLLPLVEAYIPTEAMEIVNASTALRELVLGLPVALISPMIFVLLYTVLSILMGLVYSIIMLFAGRKLRRSEKNDVPYAKAQSIAWSACSAVLALVVILLPLAFYGGLADDALDAVIATNIMDAETQGIVESINDEYVAPITKGTAVQVFRVFGGDAIIDELTSFPLKDETVYLRQEFGVLTGVVSDIIPLTTADFSNFGEKEADSLVTAVNALTESKFLVAVASEAVYFLTDDMVNGEAEIPMADNELFGGLITRVITILHNDAKHVSLFKDDLKTVAEMANVLIKGGILANMDDTDALMEELAGGNTIKSLILALGKNNNMKCLIPEITNIGIEAISSFVGVKTDANEAYNELLNTIATDLNEVMGIDDGEVQSSQLSSKLTKAFDNAGIVVSKEDIAIYTEAMLQEIVSQKNGEAVTAEDVQNFFATTTATINTAPVKDAEAYGKATLLIFLDDLVIDVERSTHKITDETVNQEAEAIGGIFSQAGTLLNEVSGEKINIGTMAESVGNILNSLSNSVCVGPERTSNLFIAIVQSGIVRDAANMDIKTATELGTKGSTGNNVDYAKTFKTISNTMDVLQNMNSSTEGGMTVEDLTTVLKDLNQQTAGMIESYITEDRLTNDYGLNQEQSATAAPLISDVFGYMGSADLTEEECAKEAEAITDVMNLVTSASDKANSGETSQSIFGGEESVLGKDANGTVETFMASESIKHSLNNNAESLEEDAFGMQDMMAEEEKEDLKTAMGDYYTNTQYETEEDRAKDAETLTNLGKLFGFSAEEMETILGK